MEYLFGVLHEHALGVDWDEDKALAELGNLYFDGVGAIPLDQEKAFHYFRQEAQADNGLGWEWAAYKAGLPDATEWRPQ